MIREDKIERDEVLAVLSKFKTKELIEALKLKEDVQICTASEDAFGLHLDLLKVKKYVLVMNNCNPQLVGYRKRLMEARRLLRFK